ncbi:MAG: hypothetical protein PQJ46_08715 [Spirochaetales bacterium]|nr:hypothetical protein [Spirochaetales bacterium]
MFGKNKDTKKRDELLQNIRDDYETLVSMYERSPNLGLQFESRYNDALKFRLNLSNFFEAEKDAVKALLKQSEDLKKAEEAQKKVSESSKEDKPSKPEEKMSYADKILKEFEDRIRQYPGLRIHPDADLEMRKLFGALANMEQEHWGTVDGIIRKAYGSKRFNESIDLEPEVNRMCIAAHDGIPSGLDTYFRLLERKPRNYTDIENEQKRCLLNAASLLKKLQMEIIKALDNSQLLGTKERQKLEDSKKYIDGIMRDFRLTDLARLV